MSNVLVNKDKLDVLANAIANKSGESLTLTLDEMVDAVDGIETGGGGITPTGNIDITSAGTTDVTNYATATVPVSDFVLTVPDSTYATENGQRKFKIRSKGSGEISGWINAEDKYGNYKAYNAIATGTSVTPTESSQSIGGSNVMLEGAVTVNAIPSNYVGSGITQRTSTDLSASGATVTAPSGYYASSATKTIASGTEGTPTATKGTVTNHSVTVTPNVTNSAGYISGGSHSGTGVSVTASELVSGSVSITSSGNTDVTNYATATVASGSATASATKGTVNNHSITVTPSVTRTAGYITAGSANGTAVTVSASELVSGSETKTSNGTYDVTNLAELVVNVSGGGGSLSYDTKTATASNYPVSLSFTSMKGEPKFFAVRLNAQVSSSGSTTYYYIVDIISNCNGSSPTIHGNCFRIGSTRRVDNITSGYSYTYSGTTLTITSSAASRSASPGAFYSGSYELIYAY